MAKKYKLNFIVNNIIETYNVLKQLSDYPYVLDPNSKEIRLLSLYRDSEKFMMVFKYLDKIEEYLEGKLTVKELRLEFESDFWYFKTPSNTLEFLKERLEFGNKLSDIKSNLVELFEGMYGENDDEFNTQLLNFLDYMNDSYRRRDYYSDGQSVGRLLREHRDVWRSYYPNEMTESEVEGIINEQSRDYIYDLSDLGNEGEYEVPIDVRSQSEVYELLVERPLRVVRTGVISNDSSWSNEEDSVSEGEIDASDEEL